jgi:hypothetical protein
MSQATFDPLFEMPFIGAVHQHLQVVIAFQNQSGARFRFSMLRLVG